MCIQGTLVNFKYYNEDFKYKKVKKWHSLCWKALLKSEKLDVTEGKLVMVRRSHSRANKHCLQNSIVIQRRSSDPKMTKSCQLLFKWIYSYGLHCKACCIIMWFVAWFMPSGQLRQSHSVKQSPIFSEAAPLDLCINAGQCYERPVRGRWSGKQFKQWHCVWTRDHSMSQHFSMSIYLKYDQLKHLGSVMSWMF